MRCAFGTVLLDDSPTPLRMTPSHGLGQALRAVEVQILMTSLDPSERRFELLTKAVSGFAHAARVLGLNDEEMLTELRRELDRGSEFNRPAWYGWRTRLLELARDRWRDADRITPPASGGYNHSHGSPRPIDRL